MSRPTVLLAVTAEVDDYRPALTAAGFDVLPLEAGTESTSADLAIIDCDLPDAEFGRIHGLIQGTKASTLLLLGERLPELPSTADGRDDIAVKPLPADALIYRLQAMLIRSGRTLPEESGA